MWRHEGEKKASIAFPPPGWLQPRKCPAPRYHWEMSVTRRVDGGIKDGSTKNVNGGWRSPGPGPD